MTQADAIAQVRDGLRESMNEFKSFVQTVNAIQEHGVEIVTKYEQHPDLHDKVVLLFAKQSVGIKILENIGSALGGAVAGAATGYYYGKRVQGDTPVITHETHALDFRLQNIEARLDGLCDAIQALSRLIDEK